MPTAVKKRTVCGFCSINTDARCRNCPGTIRNAVKGKDWTCWCSENSHVRPLPPAPVLKAAVEDEPEEPEAPHGFKEAFGSEHRKPAFEDSPEGPSDPPRPSEPPKTPKRKGTPKKERAPRCGAPTKNGPCNRVLGHTAGHDAR